MTLGLQGTLFKVDNIVGCLEPTRYFYYHHKENSVRGFEELVENDFLLNTKFRESGTFVTVTCDEETHGDAFVCRLMTRNNFSTERGMIDREGGQEDRREMLPAPVLRRRRVASLPQDIVDGRRMYSRLVEIFGSNPWYGGWY
jgi:hypothetical protein